MATQAVPANGAQHEMNQINSGAGSTWVKQRHLEARPTWKELFDYGAGCCKWLANDPARTKICFTKETNTCLVATLCYHYWDVESETEYWEVYHSTIPRVGFFELLWESGHQQAPIWHAATRKCRQTREVHAEDGTLYGFERTHKIMNRTYPKRDQGQEQLRMVVCGVTKGSPAPPTRHDICERCQTVGKTPAINVRFLLRGVATDLDRADVETQLVQKLRLLQGQLRAKYLEQQKKRPGTSASAGSDRSHYSGSDAFEGIVVTTGADGKVTFQDRGPSPPRGSPPRGTPPRGTPPPSSGGPSASGAIGGLTKAVSGLTVGQRGTAPTPGGAAARKPSTQPMAGGPARQGKKGAAPSTPSQVAGQKR
jgi:hypothetical protein